MPGGEGIVFSIFGAPAMISDDAIMYWDARSGETRRLLMGGIQAWPLGDSTLAYIQVDGRLATRGFDTATQQLDDTAVATQISVYRRFLAVSPNGDLAAIQGSSRSAESELVWLDRSGAETSVGAPTGRYRSPRFNDDGTRLAVVKAASRVCGDVWQMWLDGVSAQLWSQSGVWCSVDWTPDGDEVLATGSSGRLIALSADDSAAPQREVLSDGSGQLGGVSLDGSVVFEAGPIGAGKLRVTDLAGATPAVLLDTEADQGAPALSPDGRRLAYEADHSGQGEIYVTSFPSADDEVLVSGSGGRSPRWSADGRELFYISDGFLVAARIAESEEFAVASRDRLFAWPNPGGDVFDSYDVHPDGRFLFVRPVDQDYFIEVTFVADWVREIEPAFMR